MGQLLVHGQPDTFAIGRTFSDRLSHTTQQPPTTEDVGRVFEDAVRYRHWRSRLEDVAHVDDPATRHALYLELQEMPRPNYTYSDIDKMVAK